MDSSVNRFNRLCVDGLKARGIYDNRHMTRLKKEIRDVFNMGEYDYFLDLYDRKARYPENENNLLIAHVLGLVEDFDIDKEADFFYGEFPDVDSDFLPEVQVYLKTVWAPKTFGARNVCSICNYATFGIKSAIADMTRVFGLDIHEIQAITTQMGLKDDEGKDLTWDKAIELYPELKAYCEQYPDVASAAQRLLHRNRQMGKHAGGLIISSKPLDELIPMVRDKDGNSLSAFVEGQHGTDLSPLGLVKYDILVVVDLWRIAEACQLIRKRHGLKSICALPGQTDWSDTSYLNDSKCLKMANAGKTKCIFQFESDGMRELLKKGGVTSFDDLVAYNAIYRPAILKVGVHDVYCRRKKMEEVYEIHPLLQPILDKTYGLMIFQEQVMRVLNKVGNIPLAFCEKARKAISKKKEAGFKVYKDPFVENGQKNLEWDDEKIQILWDQVLSFSGYGFNLSHACVYSYTAARLLWLKVYYPLEFFAATLRCEGKGEKLKEYKLEAAKCGVKVKRVDINKSGWDFQIVDGEIYMGFSNIKGIGQEIAKKIVDNQPYASFADFLRKFGTDAKVLKPFIALGIFNDADRLTLQEFYEYYKDASKKRESRNARNAKSRQGLVDEMRFLIQPDYKSKTEEIIEDWREHLEIEDGFKNVVVTEIISPENLSDAWKLLKKYKKNIEGFAKKESEDKDITFEAFNPVGKIGDEKAKALCESLPQMAEQQYYGFVWDHIIEYSPNYKGGCTFDGFEDEANIVLPIEAQVCKPPVEKTSKKGTKYYVVKVEDAAGKQNSITVWEEDYNRFKEEFEKWDDQLGGNLLRLKVERPGPGFHSYTFDSPPKQLRHKIVPERKELDGRLVVLDWPNAAQMEKIKPALKIVPQQELIVVE
jgi:DNA polymerase III alpha subunit